MAVPSSIVRSLEDSPAHRAPSFARSRTRRSPSSRRSLDGSARLDVATGRRPADGHRVVPGLAGRRLRACRPAPSASCCTPTGSSPGRRRQRPRGSTIGQRRRQAQQCCPDVALLDHDPDRDARAFEPVVRAIGRFAPRLEVVEPGWLCLAARGPSRYFGGDEALAEQLVDAVDR